MPRGGFQKHVVPGRIWLPHQLWNLLGTAGADTGQSNGAPVVAVQGGAGELSVVQIGAAGDELSIAFPIPFDLDRDQKVLGRVIFCHSAAGADEPVWILKSKFHAKAAAILDMDTSEDVATTFAAHAVSTTEESLEATVWTDLSWETKLEDTDLLAGLLLECDNLGSASANEIEFMGLELMYGRKTENSARIYEMAAEILRNPV